MSRRIWAGVDVHFMETCQDCVQTIPCQFHELAIRGNWFAELEARLAAVLGPEAVDLVFDALVELEDGTPLAWTSMCCHHDLPIGTCVIPSCNDLPSFGSTHWETAQQSISAGISLN